MSSAVPRRVVIVAFEGVQALDVTGPHEVFAGANGVLGEPAPYVVEVVAVRSGAVSSESGLQLVAGPLDERADVDTLIVPGGSGVRRADDDTRLVDAIATMASRARRVVGVCSGAFLLASAGLLDGRRATTHWAARPGGSRPSARRSRSTPTRSGSATATCGRRPVSPPASTWRWRSSRTTTAWTWPRRWPAGWSCSCAGPATRASSPRRCGGNGHATSRCDGHRTSSTPTRLGTTGCRCWPHGWR